MRHLGERSVDQRSAALAALLVTALIAPFLLGAGAPAALRSMAPAPIPSALAAVEAADRSAAATGPAIRAPFSGADAPRHLGAEDIVGLDVPTRPEGAQQRARIIDLPPARAERALPAPTLRPHDPGWTARRLEIPALGINVAVAMASSAADEDFPPHAGAYILRSSSQPGRGTNSYLFAHAMPDLFKPLWWASPGQQVIVTMSDGQQLGYRVTAIVRDIPCPDPTVHKPAGLPPALANATECDLQWTLPTPTERLTMQTSQGFNRNYGEMVVIAEPDW
jgi:hypothetical protein